MISNDSLEMKTIRRLTWAKKQLREALELLEQTHPESLYQARVLAGRATKNLHDLVGPDETTYIGGSDVFATGGDI